MQLQKRQKPNNILTTYLLSVVCLVGDTACTDQGLGQRREQRQAQDAVEGSTASELLSDALTSSNETAKPVAEIEPEANTKPMESVTSHEKTDAPPKATEDVISDEDQAAMEERIAEKIAEKILAKEKAAKKAVEVEAETFKSTWAGTTIPKLGDYPFIEIRSHIDNPKTWLSPPRIRSLNASPVLVTLFNIIGTQNPVITKDWTLVVVIEYERRPLTRGQYIASWFVGGRPRKKRSGPRQLQGGKKLTDFKLVAHDTKVVAVPIKLRMPAWRFRADVREGFTMRWGLLPPNTKWSTLSAEEKEQYLQGKSKQKFPRYGEIKKIRQRRKRRRSS